VSRLADVSRMTVSRVLKEPDLVKPETRARVIQAIASLGYVPDRAAGSLASRRTGFVALVLPTLTNVNFAMVARGLTDVLRDADFQLLITYNNYSLEEEEAQLRSLLERRPEAIILTGSTHTRAATALLTQADVPVIEVADILGRPIQHAIGFSNERVGRMAARYLIGRGFRRIGALASRPQGDLADHRGEARVRGLEEELRLHGLSTDFIVREGDPPVSYDQGVLAIRSLLDRHPDVEAVFCVSDLSAVGAMMECQKRGVATPEQISILGFGDFDIGRVTNPPLSSIRVDFLDMGRQAGRLVLDLLCKDEAPAPETIDIPMELIERGSVGFGPASG
jgi:LacI family gluconate utilization system Gnt-I transcriptional repressor